MWRFHAVHHSLREMNAFNNYHHVTEQILRFPFMTIPISLLFSVNTGYIPTLILGIIHIQGQYEHSTTRINLGWFRYVVADNRYHRIHHTLNEADWGKNFGSFVPFWDMVFGTARFPKKSEWPDVGIPGVEEPKNVRSFLFMPFMLTEGDASRAQETPQAALRMVDR